LLREEEDSTLYDGGQQIIARKGGEGEEEREGGRVGSRVSGAAGWLLQQAVVAASLSSANTGKNTAASKADQFKDQLYILYILYILFSYKSHNTIDNSSDFQRMIPTLVYVFITCSSLGQ
jgi:hypothetical protein